MKTAVIIIPIVVVLVVASAVTTGVLLTLKTKQPSLCTGEECRWACKSGECVEVNEDEGTWDREEDCRCGLCGDDGKCKETSSGGAYKSVSECKKDGASKCNSELGWGCDPQSGNDQTCSQVTGGASKTLDECRCWTCAGDPPGPRSLCVHDSRGKYATKESCFADETDKCGWKYACVK